MTDQQARELTEMIMAYFKVNYKVAKQYERVLGTKQLEQIKNWHKKRATKMATSNRGRTANTHPFPHGYWHRLIKRP